LTDTKEKRLHQPPSREHVLLNVERVQQLSTADARSPSSKERPIQTLATEWKSSWYQLKLPRIAEEDNKSSPRRRLASCLSEAARLTFPFEKANDVALSARPLHVSDDGAVRVIEELDTDLGHVTGVTGTAEHLGYLRAFHWDILKTIRGTVGARLEAAGGKGKHQAKIDSTMVKKEAIS